MFSFVRTTLLRLKRESHAVTMNHFQSIFTTRPNILNHSLAFMMTQIEYLYISQNTLINNGHNISRARAYTIFDIKDVKFFFFFFGIYCAVDYLHKIFSVKSCEIFINHDVFVVKEREEDTSDVPAKLFSF